MSDHYRLNDVEPSAIVTVNGSEKKIYDNNQIFLNSNDNFEFRFFNPLQEVIGVEIIINGVQKQTSKLLLNPGEDVTLDRFLDNNKKMIFSTYFVEKNEASKNAIKKNGKIKFNFYKEKVFINLDLELNRNIFRDPPCNPNVYPDTYQPNIHPTYPTYPNVWYSSDTNGITYSNTIINTSYSTQIETGRINKGEISKQKINSVEKELEYLPFHTIEYQLLPESQNKNKRIYCSNELCKYRIRKKSWNFCPKCGQKL